MKLLYVKNLCEQKQIEIKKLAERIDMSEQNLHRCIRNNKIDAATLEKIALVLDTPISYFFETEPKSNNSISHVEGNNNILSAGGNNNVTFHNQAECEKEVVHLKAIIEEKERLIQVLMKNQ